MKIIGTGKIFRIYEDNLKTYETLPKGTYVVGFNPKSGFFLEEREDFENKEKIYGEHYKKAKKMFKSYHKMNRSLGIILSGDKGIGKSIFSRLLAIEAYKINMPVIIVNKNIDGIADFIDEIKQEVLILFDEFEKVFDDENDEQNSLLSLFDGISQVKRFYVITCNDVGNLNPYLVNRTGRFHYHIRFKYPNQAELKEYLMDSIDKKFYNQIDDVLKFAAKVPITYDTLRSIAFELNMGEKFKNVINDLNIKRLGTRVNYLVTLVNKRREFNMTTDTYLDIFDEFVTNETSFHDTLKINDIEYDVAVSFNLENFKPGKDGDLILDNENVEIKLTNKQTDEEVDASKVNHGYHKLIITVKKQNPMTYSL